MRDEDFHCWVAPVDEALNPGVARKPEGPFSLSRLKNMGIENAIKVAHLAKVERPISQTRGILQDLRSIESQIKYRMSGRWLRRRGREATFFESLKNPSQPVREFINLVVAEKLDTLLDVASGGGSAVTSLADAVGESAFIFSVERDLKCLWTIQSKFKAIERSDKCEAIGADVRKLPFRENSVSVVTSMMAVQEIVGIDLLLEEIARVLKPGGSYIALYNREPWTYDLLPLADYKRFAREARMYSGHDDFKHEVNQHGLSYENERIFTENKRELCLTTLRKGNEN
jgi:ubiquinone/menaquinone biosynthesis C-methylase UbiE